MYIEITKYNMDVVGATRPLFSTFFVIKMMYGKNRCKNNNKFTNLLYNISYVFGSWQKLIVEI